MAIGMRYSTDPCDGAFQAETEARVGHAAVATQVQIPLKRLFRQIGFADAPDKRLVARLALAAADDFAAAFGSDHVEAERQVGPHRIGGHVKGFHGRWIAMDDDRLFEFL